MIPSTATVQAAHERHGEFRRQATHAVLAAAAASGAGVPTAARFRLSPRLRWSIARPRPA
jgi:hypothetical protein